MKNYNIILIISLFLANFANAKDVEAGPIWNNDHAGEVCPNVCRDNYLIWNGNWVTTVPGRMSVCGCDESRDYEAGPIWNNDHAGEVCPNVCRDNYLIWNGNWVTTIPGRMSVCGCKVGRNWCGTPF